MTKPFNLAETPLRDLRRMSFFEFCRDVIGVELTPVQKEIYYDRFKRMKLRMYEREGRAIKWAIQTLQRKAEES